MEREWRAGGENMKESEMRWTGGSFVDLLYLAKAAMREICWVLMELRRLKSMET
jgi:hypothetical protein